ncbi:MAG: HDOD domain-containing protein [Planctomycetota bacterium]
MSVTAEQREQVVTNAMREISHIATLPEITMKIIDLVEDPKSTAQDLHQVISNDPALCSRILKVVNSSFYGLPGQIGSINRAIVMLGLNAVKNIAIAASLAKLFRGGDVTSTFSARDLWKHANAVAAASKMISDKLKFGLGDEAYLAGLIHDIGIMVEMQFDRNLLIDVIDGINVDDDGRPDRSMLDLELSVFGATHEDFGTGLCTRWKFPASFKAVTGFHHRPLEADEANRKLVAVISAADHLAAQIGFGFRLDIQDDTIPEDLASFLGLTPELIDELREQLLEAVSNLDTSLS